MTMLSDNGKFNPDWLHAQSTERLRWEASVERAVLVQLPIVPFMTAVIL